MGPGNPDGHLLVSGAAIFHFFASGGFGDADDGLRSPLPESTIGLIVLFDLAEETAQRGAEESYPPYNIERLAEDRAMTYPERSSSSKIGTCH